ncbi:hypothetical protein BCR32DRAFT_281551 [Anaeromyces robustus]|uniref:Uncharacterized protein n=1 Tax=Anaeromyces robustus TaxID=1754192 RepID=A0A1Y1X1G9_9FUNG|nr:hypothetical protein BCR32DRAFT_281551 [Anaeromyces robustus]|eukprot:ORX79266.1 hypothetical protein BCR32DRAFT_281551 [Anaeromyces robustus]
MEEILKTRIRALLKMHASTLLDKNKKKIVQEENLGENGNLNNIENFSMIKTVEAENYNALKRLQSMKISSEPARLYFKPTGDDNDLSILNSILDKHDRKLKKKKKEQWKFKIKII